MRIRRKQWARPELAVCPFFVAHPEELKGRWNGAFVRPGPIILELGCGKGGFIAQAAFESPEKNFLGVDLERGPRPCQTQRRASLCRGRPPGR